MDALLAPITGDYTGERDTSGLANAEYLCLTIPLGSYWADPTLGSRLHLLEREKDLVRVEMLAKAYAEEALARLRSRVRALTVETQRIKGLLTLVISVQGHDGSDYEFRHFVRVI